MRLNNRLGLFGLFRMDDESGKTDMTADADVSQEAAKRGSKMPLLAGLVLALAGGGGGFFAAQTGIIAGLIGKNLDATDTASHSASANAELAFVAIDPLVISLPGEDGRNHLRFSAQLEVAPDYAQEVETITPRIVDVLNGYLRAVELGVLEDPAALTRLRAQMLRRVQVVAGPGRVADLLIMEFVLS